MRKILFVALLVLCSVFLSAQAFAESANTPTKKSRDRANKVMSTLLPGPPETSYAMSDPGKKTPDADSCSCKPGSRLEKGIVSVVGGVWQLATFWYPEEGTADTVCSVCGSKTGKTPR